MILSSWPCGLAVILAVALGPLSGALADKLICVSDEKLRGEITVNNCLQKGERFGIVDDYGAVRILSKEEFDMMKKLNPKLLEMKAYGIIYLKEAPEMKKLPPPASPQTGAR
ncbi:MAG: hypothetical protein A3K23_06975 [Desulfobacca sp. RBG_16_58_9]|nr:MAG: hypothetical protein A3K23_06975 [Desulfobacca sp. RBG_16_58_9]